MRRVHRAGTAVVPAVVAVLTVILTIGALPAAARTRGQSRSTPTTAPATANPNAAGGRITLTSQDAWTPVGGDVRFGLDVADAPTDASVSVTVYQGVTSRSQYLATALGGPVSSVLSQVSVPLDAIPADATGLRTLALGLQSPTEARDVGRLNVRRPGVYPVEVELRDGADQRVAGFRTMLVVGEADRATVAEPLEVAWVWPITAPPSYLPDGEPDRDVVGSFRTNGRLGRAALALAANPDVPLTLAPTAETIEAWSSATGEDPSTQSTFEALQLALGGRTVLPGSYVPVDLPSLLDHGLGEAVDDELARGRDVLAASIGAPVDSGTRLLRPASAAALGRLSVAGADRVVVAGDALAPSAETRLTLAQPVTLTAPITPTASEPVTALVADTGLQSILNADLPPAQRAQLVLAGLAMVALEAPSVARVVTLVNPDDFDVIDVDAYQKLLDGLRNNPFLRPVTTAQAFDSVATDPPAALANGQPGSAQRELSAVETADPAITAVEYRNQRTRLNSFGALTRPGDPAVAEADRSLLASVAKGWTPDIAAARADAHLAVVDRVIDDLIAEIEVPDPRTITLTSRSGEIPLTFRNETGHPIRLRAALASDKLFFPHGSVLDLDLPPKSTTVRVAVEARTSGTFPLDLEVTSTDGVLSISQRRLEVRSTFVSTVGWVLMVSAAVFLAVWWGFDLRRRRRRRSSPTT